MMRRPHATQCDVYLAIRHKYIFEPTAHPESRGIRSEMSRIKRRAKATYRNINVLCVAI